MASSHVLPLLPYALVFLLVAHLLGNYWRLRGLPGPTLASFTDLWRLWVVYQRRAQDVHLQLHKKHGDIVRLGPNCVSISAPDTISSIYGIGKGFVKSDFYYTFQNVVNGHRVASLVAETDESLHAKSKRNVAHAYSLSTMVEYEPLVDSTTSVLLSRLDKLFADTGEICDFGKWLQFYAFDVIGELTFSKCLGFLENGTDVDNIMRSISANFDWFSVVGQMPSLDLWLGKNLIYTRFFAKPVSSPIVQFAQKLLIERVNQEQQEGKVNFGDSKEPIHSKPDFLSRFLALRAESPEPWSDKQNLGYLFANINAGSDTIASTLRAIFYYLLQNPSSLQTLLDELDQAHSSSNLTAPLPTWQETQKLPYLAAVIKEGLRMHPALSLPLERITPSSGLHLNLPNKPDIFIPPGTVVGINPYVLHRDVRIFGPDAERWNPGRWLTAEESQSKRMEHSLLTFGAGKRGCLGRNIATLELHKVVPALLLRYEIKLAQPNRKWRLHNAWLLSQEGVDVRLRYRGGEEQEKNVGL